MMRGACSTGLSQSVKRKGDRMISLIGPRRKTAAAAFAWGAAPSVNSIHVYICV